MNIRPMTSKDKSSIMHILQNTPEFTPAEVVLADQVISDYLFNPAESGYFILVAEVGTTIAGYICYGPAPITEDNPSTFVGENRRPAMNGKHVIPVLAELIYRTHFQEGSQSWAYGLMNLFKSYNIKPVKASEAAIIIVKKYVALLDKGDPGDTRYELAQTVRDNVNWFADAELQKFILKNVEHLAANERAVGVIQ